MAKQQFLDYAGLQSYDAKIKAVIASGDTKNATENTKKADKVSDAVAGNLASLDAKGNLTDSGKSISDFELAGAAKVVQGQTTATIKDVEDIAKAAVVANASITGATHTKITYDDKGLVTGGSDLAASDIPALPVDKIQGLSDQLAQKQDTLNFDGTYNPDSNKVATAQTVNSAKTALIGTPEDLSSADTINAAKKLTTEKNEAMDARVQKIEAALGGSGGEDPSSVAGQIKAAINALDVADEAVGGQYVSAVSETDGKISVTRTALPDYSKVYEPIGSAEKVKTTVIGMEGDLSSVDTIKGAKKYSDEKITAVNEALTKKVDSVAAADASVIVSEGVKPTVKVQIDNSVGNALKLVPEKGLRVDLPKASEYSIVKEESPIGYSAIYHLTKDGSNVGTAINIPKDMVVSSGEVLTNPDLQHTGTFIVLTLANAASDKLYINVGDLIEYVTSGSQLSDMVVINIDEAHKVTATITDGTINKEKLDVSVQNSLNKADSALQEANIITGVSNGTIKVNEKEVTVAGLKSAAYSEASAFATSAQGALAETAVQSADLSAISTEDIEALFA